MYTTVSGSLPALVSTSLIAACGGGGGGGGQASSNAPSAAPSAQRSSGLWTTLANTPPGALELCLLLTDASVMCQSGQDWYQLTPTNTGGYVEGTWSLYTSFPSSYIVEDFASAVLADGCAANRAADLDRPRPGSSIT